jgi:hypothetical protein
LKFVTCCRVSVIIVWRVHVLSCLWRIFLIASRAFVYLEVLFEVRHMLSYLWMFCLNFVMCFRVSGSTVSRIHVISCLWSIFWSLSLAVMSLEVLFQVRHLPSCLWKYYLKSFTCCSVSVIIAWSASRAVVFLELFLSASRAFVSL